MNQNRTVFSLLEVTRSIQKTIAERYTSIYWIKAEMNKLNHYTHSGHCYPELVEKKSGKIVAEIRSILWKTDYNRINSQFIQIAQEPLREGITMLFQAQISYDPLYGLSLRIVDIDPTFTLGELEKEKQASIQKLQEEGIFDANRKLSFPLVPKRLAIISVETSKGLSDFYKIINHNPWGYLIQSKLFPALLQGDKSILSIIKQLNNVAEQLDSFDAVAIIRGGGGEVGLSSFNNYLLAKAIAIFPLPVLTGIGHSTNLTVSEMVAYKNAITPSELADFLIQRFHQFAFPLDRASDIFGQLTNTILHTERVKLIQLTNSLQWMARQGIETAGISLTYMQQQLRNTIMISINDQKIMLNHTEKVLLLSDPIRLLKKGYSITESNGTLITSLMQVQKGELLETRLEDGKIKSIITEIEEE